MPDRIHNLCNDQDDRQHLQAVVVVLVGLVGSGECSMEPQLLWKQTQRPRMEEERLATELQGLIYQLEVCICGRVLLIWLVVLGEGQGQSHHTTPANGGDRLSSVV